MSMNTTLDNAPSRIAGEREFTASCMFARRGGFARNTANEGWLRGQALDTFRRDIKQIDYIVFSFYTPIAWHTPERGWVHVGKSFSSRSSRHQGLARQGIHYHNDSRVEEVNKPYSLTVAQSTLLWLALRAVARDTATRPTISATGQARRSAAKLVELGLLTDLHNDQYEATEAARNWARS